MNGGLGGGYLLPGVHETLGHPLAGSFRFQCKSKGSCGAGAHAEAAADAADRIELKRPLIHGKCIHAAPVDADPAGYA